MNIFKLTCYLLFVSWLLLLRSTSSFGQNNTAGLNVTSTINYRKLSSNSDYLNKFDKKAVIFSGGIFYNRHLFQRLSLGTGIDYSLVGYNRKPVFSGDLTGTYTASYKYRLSYLGIPVTLNLAAIRNRKFSLYIAAGVVNKFLLFARYHPYDLQRPPLYYGNGAPNLTKPTTVKINHNSLKSKGYNMYAPDLKCNLEFNYKFKNATVGLSPELMYSLVSTTKDLTYFHTYQEHLFSYGLKISISKNW